MPASNTQSQAVGRLSSLDGLRALALSRVVIWHVTGWAAATWIVAAVPSMFAVTGGLLARSYSTRSTSSALVSRARRLFPALWCYSGLIFLTSKAYDAETSPLWTFFIPLVQPTSSLGGEWFTSALWYLQSYVWVLILSPLLWRIAQLHGTTAVMSGSLVVSVLSFTEVTTTGIMWQVGNVVLYSTCALAGMVWLRDGTPERSHLVAVAAVSAALTAVWLAVRPSSDMVVNNDHALHLLVGAFWSAALLALPGALGWISRTNWAQLINARSLTVYLWHSAIAWLAWQVTPGQFTGIVRTFIVLAATCTALPFVIVTVGLVEKRDTGWTEPRLLIARALIVIVAAVVVASPPVTSRVDIYSAPGDQPLPPSAAPTIETITVSGDVRLEAKPRDPTGADWTEREEQLQELLIATDAEMKLGGTRVLVVDPDGRSWSGRTSDAREWQEPSLVGSITKTFTTALVMRLVERGVLELDEPVGDLGLSFRHSRVTLRQLLTHRAGMPEMSRSRDLAEDGTTPEKVITWLNDHELRFQPGSKTEYSTTGFVVVGIAVEQATGRHYEDLINEEFAGPLGYTLGYFRGRYKSIGFSTGGIIMNMTDLSDWIRRYAGERSLTTEPWPWAIDVTTGLGVHGYCPCDDGTFTAFGHMGGRTFATVDADGFTVIIDTRGVLVLDNYRRTQQFAQELRLLAGGGRMKRPGD